MLVAGGAVLAGWRGDGPPAAVAADDVSGRPTVCMAADTATAAGSSAVDAVWSTLRAGAGEGRAGEPARNVQQLVVPAGDAEHARPYLAGLVQRRCDLIVTVGRPFGRAAADLAGTTASVRFTAVDSGVSGSPAGVTLLTAGRAGDTLRAEMAALAPVAGPSAGP